LRRRFNWDKKYLYWGITAFCVIAASILFFMALNYIGTVSSLMSKLVTIFSPFIWGFVITYLLLPIVKRIESDMVRPLIKLIRGELAKRKDNPKPKKKYTGKYSRYINKVTDFFAACVAFIRKYTDKYLSKAETQPKPKKEADSSKWERGISVVLGEMLFIAALTLLVYMIIPQLVDSLYNLIANSNSYIDTTTKWIEEILADYPAFEAQVQPILDNLSVMITDFVKTTLLPGIGSLASSLTTGVISAVKAIYNLVIGIVVSCYILASYENFSAKAKKLLYAIFSVQSSEKILYGIDFVDRTFMGFINGKLLDSAIVAIICYVGCAILGMPYTLLVSAIIGVTNVIPFFGPIIGLVPSALLILFVNPLKSLIFIIFVLVLQQIDGNVIGPKILGNSVGITGFNVMFAIIVGAGFFGFWGMLLGVPVFVVIYNVLKGVLNRKLKNAGLPVSGDEYLNIDHIDPDTLRPVEKGRENSRAKRGAAPVRLKEKISDTADTAAETETAEEK